MSSESRSTAPPRPRGALSKGSPTRAPLLILGYAMLLAVALMMVLPFVWMLSTSFKDTKAFYVFPPQFIPDNPTFENYTTFFERGAWRYLRNTVFISLMVTLIVVVTSTMAGYALAKVPFRGRNLIFATLLSGLMIPWEITIIPLYIIVVKIGWVNTYQGVILPMSAPPRGIFIMRQFLRSLEVAAIAIVIGERGPRLRIVGIQLPCLLQQRQHFAIAIP